MNSKWPTISSHLDFIFYGVVIFLTFTDISSSDGSNDHEALLKIKSMITQDPYGALSSWNNSLHFCDWNGVTCDKRHKRVIALGLESQSLEGYMSPYVGNLSFLRKLSLTNNSFQGGIPHEFGRLSRIRFLYLGSNMFNRDIPANICGCSNLEELDFSNNELEGRIPKEMSFLSKLITVLLHYNKLTHGIPPFLGNITSIQVMSLSGNPFGGSIPETFGHWKSLKEIYCDTCNLSGTIPYSIYNLSLLTNITLADNQLTGTLPRATGIMLPSIVFFQLRDNQLSGRFPSWISNCSRLRGLEIDGNKFSGELEIDFAKLRNVYVLVLGNNNFGSKDDDGLKFIDSLKNCTKLEVLYLGNCMLQGSVPTSIGNLSNQLRLLSLTGNQLHGSLPGSIGNLHSLARLSLSDNQLTGNIPSTIGNLQKLVVVYLYENRLSGMIPNTMGNLSSLITIDLSSNMLEGAIPSSLGNCHRLLELYLNHNNLNGIIPTKLLQLSSLSKKLDLSQNNLFGSLPIEVGNLKMLSELDLSHNNLSGNIPSSLSGCASISSLSLKRNLFQGIIPQSLILLKGLEQLDISHNKLSGRIPQFLERLRYLNLSYNNFEGEVPTSGVFANATTFSIRGNSRLCGGIIEFGLPKCKEAKKHAKRVNLFIIAILIACTLFSVTIYLVYVWRKKKSKSRLYQPSTIERFMKVSYSQLLKATNGFSDANLIGKGGFSSVYKGILDEDEHTSVAIKVLHLQNRGAERSFTRECEAWQNIRHRNLLKIITSCSGVDYHGNDFKALVYEFMPNGSLHDWLHSSKSTPRLNLLQIINIAMDVASALDYIHNCCVPSVVHGDVKPSNILLDANMVAHVGDFGLSRFLGTASYENNSTGIRGTIGYAAPEYGLGNEMTSSGDVYSFGILLLELMTRKTPTDNIFNEDLSLHRFASMALPDHVTDIIDANILKMYQEDDFLMKKKQANVKKIKECLASMVRIGVSCTMESPSQRMNMTKVVHELQDIRNTLQHI